MTDQELPELDDLDQLWPKWLELKEPLERDYAQAVAPARKTRGQKLADLQREYAQKVQLAKSDYYQAQRRFKETTYELKRWKDASERVVEQEYRAVQSIASKTRKRKMDPLQTWFERQRERLLKQKADEQAAQAGQP